MAKRIGDASPPAGNIPLRDARRELIETVHSGEQAKAMSDFAETMAGEARDPGRINAIYSRINEIEDTAIRSIRDAMRNGGIAAYFEGHGGERSIPIGWLDADWLRKQLLIDGAVPIDECDNRDRNGSKRLVYFRLEEWKALLPTLTRKGDIPTRQLKRGPKFKYDWEEGRQFFAKLMADMGDLDDRQEWSAQADAEKKVMAHMKLHGGGEPAPSLVQDHVKQWLTDFRAANTNN
jgi:hypothetical protein